MTIDVEHELAQTLRTRAADVGQHPDPWTRYIVARRSSTRRRRVRRAGLTLAAAAAVAGVMLNAIPVPSVIPVVPVGPTSSDSLLWDEPTRGSLARDDAWLAGLRAAVRDVSEVEGVWRVAGRDRIRLIFAGDVGDQRLALVVVPLRLGVIEVQESMWYVGKVGAAARDMEQGGNFGELPDVVTTMEGDEDGGELVVVAPTGTRIETSLAASFGADGRLHRDWAVAADESGVALVDLPGASDAPPVVVRVRAGGDVVYSGPVMDYTWGDEGAEETRRDSISDADLDAALAAGRGRSLDRELARAWVDIALHETRTPADQATVRIPWSGNIRGKAAALVTVQPDGGGVVAFGFHGDQEFLSYDLHLLMPADGAYTRPIAWRLRPAGSDQPAREIEATTVVVVAPAGTERAELVQDGNVTPLDLSADGSATLRAGTADEILVRAYDAKGDLFGETSVAPLTDSSAGLPGEDRATRLVD